MFNNKITLGVILYLFSALISVSSNIFVKKVMVDYHLPAWEAITVRQSIIVAILLPFMIKMRFNFFKKETFKWNVLRDVLYAISIGIMHVAMFKIPVNNGTSLQFLTPVIASILAIFFLKEKNSIWIWISLSVCLCGALIIQTPSFSNIKIVHAYVLLLISIILKSIITILNRKLALKFDISILIFYMHTIILFVSLLFCWEFITFPPIVVMILGVVGIFYLLEYIMIYTAYRYCDVVFIQPLEFSKIIYSIVLSNLVLGETTNYLQLFGISVIVFGFLIMLFSKKYFKKRN